MSKNKKSKYFFRTLFVFFVIYVALLIAYESGYYTSRMSNKATLTKEAMEKFENDVASGEIVDIKNYLEDDNVDYSNNITKIGNKVSNSISKIMTEGLSGIFGALKGLFW